MADTQRLRCCCQFQAICSTNAAAPPAAGEARRPFNPFWNIHGANKLGITVKKLDKSLYGPYLNFVGLPRDMTYLNLNGKVSRSWYVDREITPNNLRPEEKRDMRVCIAML
jgi:hypothetical protein